MSFHIQLTEGIVGGFKPPTVKRVIEINGDPSGGFVQQSTLEGRDDYRVQNGEITSQEINALVTDLRSTLRVLPTESPAGGEDIYGFDTSIHIQTDDGFEWRNGGPEGCTHHESKTKPTEEQKAIFQELISKISGVGQRFAIKSVS
ncbi:9551_t:CDS:2 [Ambispora gerdemannii]|uniref:9551_t:CDS:1 n=1 Tax=Ambispora gerdemannii TaxID=144530 RepID=A0A9N9GV55_9GLOM|nr:9551_t:CDS:2 [Ambispora gerdemannii]